MPGDDIKAQLVALGVDDGELERLLRAGERLETKLIDKIHDCGLFPPPLTVRSRVKDKNDIVAKIRRKRKEKPDFGLNDISDIVGLRFVTPLRLDSIAVVENLLRLMTMDRSESTADHHFGRARLIDFVRYGLPLPAANDQELRDEVDRLFEGLSAVFASYKTLTGHLILINERRAQYSSIHLHLMIPFDMGRGKMLDVPVEVQFRSVFEDAWGEFDHKLFYEADRAAGLEEPGGRDVARPVFDRESKSRQLRVLKGMMDNAEEYAAEISGRSSAARANNPPDIKKSLDDVEYVKRLFEPVATNSELFKEEIRLTDDKIKMDARVNAGEDDPSKYVGLAAKFASLAAKLNKVADVPPHEESRYLTARYLLAMEEAVCRFLSGDPEQLRIAYDAYLGICKVYKAFPACRFRLAQACAQRMEQVSEGPARDKFALEAAERYAEARKLLDQTKDDTDNLLISPGQRDYIANNIERLWSFVIWRRSDMRRAPGVPVTADDLDAVKKAYGIALEGLGGKAGLAGEVKNFPLLNNATYFAVDLLKIARELSTPSADLPAREEVLDMVRAFERSCERLKSRNVQQWHTVMAGYRDLGLKDEAQQISVKVLNLFSTLTTEEIARMSAYERETLQRAVKEAWAVFHPESGTPPLG